MALALVLDLWDFLVVFSLIALKWALVARTLHATKKNTTAVEIRLMMVILW